MQSTSKIPNISVGKFKRTKIVATVGPSTNLYEMILKMMKAGVNGFRLNFSHSIEEKRLPFLCFLLVTSCGVEFFTAKTHGEYMTKL